MIETAISSLVLYIEGRVGTGVLMVREQVIARLAADTEQSIIRAIASIVCLLLCNVSI